MVAQCTSLVKSLKCQFFLQIAFSDLTLLFGQQERDPAREKLSGGCWRGYAFGLRCRFAYGPTDATATISCFSKSRLVLPSC